MKWALRVFVVASMLGPGLAAAARPSDAEAITALILCYARGTDAIGDATTHADPLASGRAVYRQCLAPDAEIRGWFPQRPFDAQAFPDPTAHPDTAPRAIRGPDAWAEHVNSVFRGKGYTFTQHAISNVEISVDGTRGTLTAYLTATLVISGLAVGDPSRCVTAANGTYSANVKKQRAGWRIARLYLTLITFNPIFQSGEGCH